MYIIGLNAYHGDSSACLIHNGQLLAAVEEERFRRIKHWAGFPSKSIEYCLAEANISLEQIDYIAINSDSKANILKKIVYTLKNKPNLSFILDRVKNRQQRADISGELKEAFHDATFSGEIIPVEHHLAHLASAHTVSPFEESIVLSVDGFGDFSSAAWGIGSGSKITIDNRVFFPHSLGIFYSALTQFIGFPHYGDEYKVMGLAPYGKPTYLTQLRDVVKLSADGTFKLNLRYFCHHKAGVEYEWEGGSPIVGQLFTNELEKLLGFPVRLKDEPLEDCHWDLAHSIQAMYEEAFFNILDAAHKKYKIDTLTLAGGCAMNSVANGKVYRQSPFKKMYIQSAAGDAGGAIGAAFTVWHDTLKNEKRNFVMNHAYLGPEYSNDEIKSVLDSRNSDIKSANCQIEKIANEETLCQQTAIAISEGKVIGWFQGRMEWGPRALGNRSIVCDPRRADMKDILNLKIKRRESFRPFAPSILRESVLEWFEEEDDVPFMMQVFQIREEKRNEIPAVTHNDGSGRLQTVHKDTNPRYYKLIECFKDLSGVPIVLNTSFNENEPVVCTPEEALNCFLRTKMDILVLGDWFIKRNE